MAYNASSADAAISVIDRECANLKSQISEFKNIFATMKANGWKGNSSTTFYNDFEKYSAQLSRLSEQLSDLHTEAIKVNNLAKQFNEAAGEGA